jgi:acetyl-CoA/propionyl-CoA carboxylase biotin carboxyl carrier protein
LAILEHPDFATGAHSTRWVDETLDLSGVTSTAMRTPDSDGGTGPVASRDVDVEVEGRRFKVRVWAPPGGAGPGSAVPSARARRHGQAQGTGAAPGRVTAPMQGTIVEVLVGVGDAVEAGQPICVLEAMKMENLVNADRAGTVAEVRVSPGDTVGTGDVVIVVE